MRLLKELEKGEVYILRHYNLRKKKGIAEDVWSKNDNVTILRDFIYQSLIFLGNSDSLSKTLMQKINVKSPY